MNRTAIDWTDTESAAKEAAGNWREFNCFGWQRQFDLEDPDAWTIHYTSNRDSGLLDQSNSAQITKRMKLFSEGNDPDVVFESHAHWAVGHVDGFSLRVHRPDGSFTPAFQELCRVQAKMEDYPILNESDYSEREYEATLENYRNEMWRMRKELPEGWEAEVFSYFADNDDQFTENRDDQGGYAPEKEIVKALDSLGLTGVTP